MPLSSRSEVDLPRDLCISASRLTVLYNPHESLPWNPLIARVFYRLGIIETWGRGTIKIAELTKPVGLPIPDIEDAGVECDGSECSDCTIRATPACLHATLRIGSNPFWHC